MTPDRLRECLALLRWSQRGLADALGADERQVRRWAAGQYPMPAPIAAWLDRLAAYHAKHPPPEHRVIHAAREAAEMARD